MSDKPERNDPCHCGSGRKYKNCCYEKDHSKVSSKFWMIGLAVAVILGLLFLVSALTGGSGTPDCPPGQQWSALHQHCH